MPGITPATLAVIPTVVAVVVKRQASMKPTTDNEETLLWPGDGTRLWPPPRCL